MAVNARQHRASVSNVDSHGAKKLGVRWACTCGRVGRWTFSTADAERSARTHEKRFTKGS